MSPHSDSPLARTLDPHSLHDRFKTILGIRDAKNEIVVASRAHAGGFPIHAQRDGNILRCFQINGDAKRMSRATITHMGHFSGG